MALPYSFGLYAYFRDNNYGHGTARFRTNSAFAVIVYFAVVDVFLTLKGLLNVTLLIGRQELLGSRTHHYMIFISLLVIITLFNGGHNWDSEYDQGYRDRGGVAIVVTTALVFLTWFLVMGKPLR